MATHNWNGHTIEVKSHASPLLLWFGISFSVAIDGSERLSSPKHFEGLRSTIPFKFLHNGNLVEGHVVSGRPCSVLHAVYRVMIDNNEVARGSVRASNWYITYAIMGVTLIAMMKWLL